MNHSPSCNGLACDCPSVEDLLAQAIESHNALLRGEGCPPWMTLEAATKAAELEVAQLLDRAQPPEALLGFDTDLE